MPAMGRSEERPRRRVGRSSVTACVAALAVVFLALGTYVRTARVDAAGSAITIYRGTSSFGITAGPDGALWFTNWDSIGRISTDGVSSDYTGPGISEALGITVGPDGALWFTN